jgi:hypothetical protein
VAQQASNLQNPQCKDVDITFFNAPFPFDEAYSYLTNAFQSMAFIQKGFYCTICDGNMQQYLMIPRQFSRLGLVLSQKSCDDLIYRFKEYIMYKTYYLDMFYLNASKLFNCVENSNQYNFRPEYEAQYQEIKQCVESGHNCNIVCQEFRVGGFSELFMGDLKKYEAFHAKFLSFLEGQGINTEKVTDQVYVPEYTMSTNDFFNPNRVRSELEEETVTVGRVSDMEIIVHPTGIDLFDIAQKSGYYVSDQNSSLEKSRLFNHSEGGQSGTLLSNGVHESDAEKAAYQERGPDGLTVQQIGRNLLKLFLILRGGQGEDARIISGEQAEL